MTRSFEQALTGISGILVTPYDADGDIAPERLTPIIDRALAAGVHLPVVNGNTSEFYALSTDEACRMVAAVTDLVEGRAPVLAGIGRALPDALRLAKASVQAGASALMIPTGSLRRPTGCCGLCAGHSGGVRWFASGAVSTQRCLGH